MILSWFSRQTFWWIIKRDCCLWALSGTEGGEGTISKMCVQFNILDSILIFVPNIWGSFQVWLLSLAKRTIAKMCEQFNILDFILIFVPNSWGSYQVRLLSLGPEGGLDCTNSKKMSVHFNIFYSSLILCQQFGGVFKLDCCLWALWEGGHNF